MTSTVADAEAALFAEALTCTGGFPVRYAADAPEAGSVDRAIETAEALLRSIALVEDTHSDEVEDHGVQELALQRVEAKLSLVLETLGALLRRQIPQMPVRTIRWSRYGVALTLPATEPLPERGFLVIQPVTWVPQQIELPVVRLAVEPDGEQQRVWLRFDPQPVPLEAAVERHLFRLHRREIANHRARGG